MNETAREICERAFAVLDHVAEEEARWEAERQAETLFQRIQRENEEADAFSAQLLEQRRRLARQPEPKEMPQPKMQQQIDRDWNAWFTASFEDRFKNRIAVERELSSKCLNALAEMAGATCGRLEKEIRTLKQEVAALRCDVEVLTKHKAAKSDVVPLRFAHERR